MTTLEKTTFNTQELLQPKNQIKVLQSYGKNFEKNISNLPSYENGLTANNLGIFQVNIGKLCNQVCKHCHVDASPSRTELMTKEVMQQCLEVIKTVDSIHTVDITGGAPEMNPNFKFFVEEIVKLGKHIVDRCNLTILEEDGYDYLYDFLAKNEVEIVASLPHFSQSNTDKQRGNGVFEKSIVALQKLNALGYGLSSKLKLNLVYNPIGLFLSNSQEQLEMEFKQALQTKHQVVFNQLYCINNLPVHRFLVSLWKKEKFETYMDILANAFNPSTVDGLMCRNQVSVSYDGNIYDCDFNQMLELNVQNRDNEKMHVSNFDLDSFLSRNITLKNHCYGCTAGAGSSCGGEIV